MRMMAVVLMLATMGCKKHEPAGSAAGSAGSAAPAGSGGSAGSAVAAGSAGSATGSAAAPDPWAGSASSDGSGSAAAPETAAASTGDKLGSDVMDKETIGGVALHDGADKVTTALGAPTKKSKIEDEEATGSTVQTWEYGASRVTMQKVDGKWTAYTIQVVAPTDWKTSKGIHLGSTKAEVQAAYAGTREDDGILVGSPYGGELFTIKGGKVTQIFLGAMAE